MPNHRSTEVANEFLRQRGALGTLTQMQLQKLAFIANGFSIALSNEDLIEDSFKAWDFGPVAPYLRKYTEFYGRKPITRLISPSDHGFSFFLDGEERAAPYRANLTDYERQIVQNVYQRYGQLSGIQLSKLTHQPDTPWHRAYVRGRNTLILRDDIADHYIQLVNGIAA